MKNIKQFMALESVDEHMKQVEAVVNKAYELHVPAAQDSIFWTLKDDMRIVQRRNIATLHAHLAIKHLLDWLTTNLAKYNHKVFNVRFFNDLSDVLREYKHSLYSQLPVLRVLSVFEWTGWSLEVNYSHMSGKHTTYADDKVYVPLNFNKYILDKRLTVNEELILRLDTLKNNNQQAIDNTLKALRAGTNLKTVERVFRMAVKAYSQFNEFKNQLSTLYQSQMGNVQWPSYHPTVPRLYH